MSRDWRGEIVGHRGAAGLAPENTLASFEAAIEAGCDRVEFDLRVTANRELVVFHDARLGRFVEGGDLQPAVFRRHSRELTALDVGEALGRPGCPVPLFSELLEALAGRVALNPEIKGSGAEGLVAATRVAEALGGREDLGDCVLSSFQAPVLAEMRRLAPDLPRALLFGRKSSGDPIAGALRLECTALHVHRELLDEELFEACRAEGLALRVFTLNAEADMMDAMRMGVDGIVTDRPDLLRELAGR